MSDTSDSASTKPRRSQLSMRPLMMVVLAVFVSVYFGWVDSILDRVLPQRRIIAKLESLGATIEYDDQYESDDAPFGLALIRSYIGDIRDDLLDHVESVGLDANQSLSDDDLALLTELPEIRTLGLRGSHITDRAMQYAAQLPKLELLVLDSTSVTADGLAQLSIADGLKTLLFAGAVTDDMLKSVGTLSNLRELGFGETKFTSADFGHLAGLRNLKGLAIMDSSMTEGLRNVDKIQSLELLFLYNVAIADEGCSQLCGLSRLTSLTVCGTKISDAGIRDLAHLHKLERLEMQGVPITDDALVHLAGLHQLEDLRLSSTKVSDDGLVHLKGLEKLESLDLGDTKVSDDGLVHLKGMEKLRSLWLGSTEVSDAGLEHIASIRSLETLWLRGTKVTAEGRAIVKNLDHLGPEFNASKQTVIDELDELFPTHSIQ